MDNRDNPPQPQPQPRQERKRYNIDSHRNIIPLNGGFPAFKTVFTARSLNKFQGVVVDQNTLDTATNLEYRNSNPTTEGEWFNGELEYTDSLPRQFYLVLIAEEPAEVDLEMYTEPRQPKPDLPPQIPEKPAETPAVENSTGSNKWVTISIIIIITVVVCGLLMGVTKKSGGMAQLPDLDSLLANF